MRERGVSLLATVVTALVLQGCSVLYNLDGYDDGSGTTSGGGATSTSSSSATGGGGASPGSKYEAAVRADMPVAYWRLGERSGVVAHDVTGRYDGEYVDVDAGESGAIANDDDTAVGFTKKTSAVKSIPRFSTFSGGGAFTIEVWAKPDYAHSVSEAGLPRLLTQEDAVAGKQEGLSLVDTASSHGLTFQTYAAGAFVGGYTGAQLVDRSWSHVVVTFGRGGDAGGTLTIYVNDSIGYQHEADIDLDNADIPLVLGSLSSADGNAWSGELDEIAIYDHALTGERVDVHYHAAGR